MEGNDSGGCNDDCSSSYVEMDIYKSILQENNETISHGLHNTLSSLFTCSSSNSRCLEIWKLVKRWKWRHRLRQKVRFKCLNNSKKWKGVDHAQLLRKKFHRICEPENLDSLASVSCKEIVSDNVSLDDDDLSISSDGENDNLIDNDNNVEVSIEKQFSQEDWCSVDC